MMRRGIGAGAKKYRPARPPAVFCLQFMAGAAEAILSAVRSGDFKSIPRRLWFLQRKRGLRKRIFRQYGKSTDNEVKEVMAFLATHPTQELPVGMTPPYEWVQELNPDGVPVRRDSATGMWLTSVHGHQVFFNRNATPAEVQRAVSIAIMEQDPRSPHSYLNGCHTVDAGDVAVFVGASDGIFCLSLVDRISKAYLFEPDPNWSEPLKATMKTWADKIEIVPLALGNRDSEKMIRLDSFFANRSQPNFIQLDVEGAEHDVLAGAADLLRSARKLRFSICAYHQRLDFQTFAALLGGLGYDIGHSPGYYVLGVRMPYLRRGVLYASRGTAQEL